LIAYFVLGLVVIAVAVKVLFWVIGLVASLVAVAVSLAIVVGVGYLAYLLIRAAIKSSS